MTVTVNATDSYGEPQDGTSWSLDDNDILSVLDPDSNVVAQYLNWESVTTDQFAPAPVEPVVEDVPAPVAPTTPGTTLRVPPPTQPDAPANVAVNAPVDPVQPDPAPAPVVAPAPEPEPVPAAPVDTPAPADPTAPTVDTPPVA